ncbi:MAG: hypothetical protein KDD66_04165 [Bdellovibrionales bacterium]|nr:hypothetical protein [Bdellovibrionales bacterium]
MVRFNKLLSEKGATMLEYVVTANMALIALVAISEFKFATGWSYAYSSCIIAGGSEGDEGGTWEELVIPAGVVDNTGLQHDCAWIVYNYENR